MREYILLLPILFIIHDMEEIIGFERFYKKNGDLFEKFPKITMRFKGVKADAFALAVYEEFIPFCGVSLLAYYFPGKVLYALWYSRMLALTWHFVMHIGQSILIKRFVPSLITSIICLPFGVIILCKCAEFIVFDVMTVLLIAVGIIFMVVNLFIAHIIMHRYNDKE